MAGTRGAVSMYRNLDVGVTGQVIKAGPGQILGLQITNQAAASRYLKFYNKATAPTEADTPVKTLAFRQGTFLMIPLTNPWIFTAGISIRASNVIADNDTTATSTNDVIVNMEYQ